MALFFFPELDRRTRELMLEEFQMDQTTPGGVYTGKRLNATGITAYLEALPPALLTGSPADLQRILEPVPGALWVPEILARNGRRSTTPRTAAQTLAEGEFNRYYMRAICRRALLEGNGRVVVYRAKAVSSPRSDPSVKVDVDDELDAQAVLQDLRRHPGEDTELGIPRGPNSGLSLRFGTS